MAVPLPAPVERVDLALYEMVRRQLHQAPLVRVAVAMSRLGEHAAVWLLIGATGTAATRNRRWATATASVAVAHGVNVAVKQVVRRPRPKVEDLPALAWVPSQMSFPSAHAASAFAAAAAFQPLLPHWPWRATAGVMAVSRLVAGVHYPSDIVAGAVLGTAVGLAGRRLGRDVRS